MTDTQLPVVTIQKGRSTRVRRGHPWLFSNEVDMTPETKALPPGSLVAVRDAGDERMGIATFNPHSLIAGRMMTRSWATTVDAGLLAARLAHARDLRDRLFGQPYYRLVHSEADNLPGLIVDRYGDVLSVQTNTAGMEKLLPDLLEALQKVLKPSAIVLRNESSVRTLEGMELYHRVAVGTVEGPVQLIENGVSFLVDVAEGQKTGWFYDQRPNRAFVAGLAKDRKVLDVYCYAGGFGIQAVAAGAASALLVDRADSALDLARRSAEANGLTGRIDTRVGDGFKVMEELAAAGERFGVVVADPPAFVKSKKELGSGAKGYRKMARLAGALVEPGGILLCGSCSHHMTHELFHDEVIHGLSLAGRTGRILWSHGAGPDHPVHPLLPESAYLKVLVFQVD